MITKNFIKEDMPTSLVFSKYNLDHLIIGTDKGKMYLFDCQTGACINQIKSDHTHRVGVLAASENLIASGSKDRTINVVDLRSNELISVYKSHT